MTSLNTPLYLLIEHILAEENFEQAAARVLLHGLDQIDEVVAESEYAGHAATLRGSIHLRSNDGYRAVAQAGRPDAPASDALAAASMWEWVHQYQQPLAFDLALGMLALLDSGEDAFVEIDDPRDSEISGRTSLVIFLERDATHALLMPLFDVRNAIVGMACFEVRCERALGSSFVWSDCEMGIRGLLAATLPYLLEKPTSNSEQDSLCDAFLPVLGDTMRPRVRLLEAFSKQLETILLSGPTGVGKTRMARWCHARSSRSDGPFEVLDLLSVPETMQMAHLVGWRRGAFTSADRDVDGAIERAAGGTLFIDEIDKLSLETQAGLLNLLETRSFQRLGDSRGTQRADVRFIVGTNADLKARVDAGAFREDLYYRIQVLPVHIVPLSERRDEIEPWSRYMLERVARQRGAGGAVTITGAAARLLRDQPWPGNLRQLDNVMLRVFALSRGRHTGESIVVVPEDVELALGMEGGGVAEPLSQARRALERAADAFVSAAQAASERGDSLSLDHSDALKGLILLAARERVETLDEVFSLLGKENLLSNRNHHKAWNRETSRARDILGELEE